jgi:hypothetical protein
MISFIVKDNPKHPIVKALRETEGSKWDESQLVYMPYTSESCGWCIDGYFINYTIKSSIKTLESERWLK